MSLYLPVFFLFDIYYYQKTSDLQQILEIKCFGKKRHALNWKIKFQQGGVKLKCSIEKRL